MSMVIRKTGFPGTLQRQSLEQLEANLSALETALQQAELMQCFDIIHLHTDSYSNVLLEEAKTKAAEDQNYPVQADQVTGITIQGPEHDYDPEEFHPRLSVTLEMESNSWNRYTSAEISCNHYQQKDFEKFTQVLEETLSQQSPN